VDGNERRAFQKQPASIHNGSRRTKLHYQERFLFKALKPDSMIFRISTGKLD
jgi:hypothetical protein